MATGVPLTTACNFFLAPGRVPAPPVSCERLLLSSLLLLVRQLYPLSSLPAMSKFKPFSLRHLMAAYGAYHQHWFNQIIHFIFVPSIVYSLFMLASYLPQNQKDAIFFSTSGCECLNKYPLLEQHQLMLPVVAVLGLYYILLDKVIGSVVACELAALWYASNYTLEYVGREDAFRYALILQVGSWLVQFFGHFVEGRRPALLDNLFQVFAAPMFVVVEAFFFLGYRWDVKMDVEKMIKNFEFDERMTRKSQKAY